MKKKVIYLVVLAVLFNSMIFVVGCRVPRCGNTPATFNIISMEVRNVGLASPESLSGGPTLPDQSTVPFNEFAILLEPDAEYVNSQNTNWHLEGFLINSAYACSPPPPVSDEIVNTISITSDADFALDGQVIEAGNILNQLFSIRDIRWEETPLDDYNNNTDSEDKAVNEENYLVKLTTAPTANQTHRFTVVYSHRDGETYTLITESLEITP